MIQFCPIMLNEEYSKKWNERMNDFIHLCDENGDKISDALYRVGGFGGRFKDGYCELIKYVEEFYDDSITSEINRKRHLEGYWCIINSEGREKFVANKFESVYHIGGIIAKSERSFINIETKERFLNGECKYMESKNFIFIDNPYDKDKSKRGIYKINKFDFSIEIFP